MFKLKWRFATLLYILRGFWGVHDTLTYVISKLRFKISKTGYTKFNMLRVKEGTI